ncbi:MAG: CRTAC1 family protein [Caldilineaceae bacterium]|nr:CRTAC1 family protein [Caldilineaceae bacterium]
MAATFVAATLLLAWTHGQSSASASTPGGTLAAVDVATHALEPAAPCTDSFVSHRLDFSTGTRLREISTYISNGSGVAANDLDGDGDLDLVFAGIDRENEILWNRGDLTFEAEPLDDRFARGVAIVDVNGDGAQDIVFSHRGLEGVTYWRNFGDLGGRTRFARWPLSGVDSYAYALAWGDVDGNGILDLVTGSYAAELKQHGVTAPAEDPRAGVVVHLQQADGTFVSETLDPVAETLSVGLVDVTGDGQPEIWVANDFAVRDQLWTRADDGTWTLLEPFDQTAHSTMSLEWGDIRNDGAPVLLSTDMHPYDTSPKTMAEWRPMMEQMGEHHEEGDPQIMANVLQVPTDEGWSNEAADRHVDATGWSWAARFGDLDRDGFLDLYVVNGMIAADMFGHLPADELVEENQAFRNDGAGMFMPMPSWGLGSTASGRGMIMADMDGDGDLDIVVNNLRGSAQLMENQLCGGDSLLVDLIWEGNENRHAIGAEVRLETDAGVLVRDVRASGNYLSGDPAQVHFGIPAEAAIKALEIRWPDGVYSSVDAPAAGTRLIVTRSEDGS